MFKELSKKAIPSREQETLSFWKEANIFEKSVAQRAKGPFFSFVDGPPFATGLPHYGHLLAGTIKDVILRYKTMRGFHVPRRYGWDCHGLPVENEIEKLHNLNGAHAIEEFGIAHFNEECRKIVNRYTGEWKGTVERMGRWVDFSSTYRTMDRSFMESVWWVFKQLYDKGLVYEGYKVMPFSAKLGTPLSNFEASENYKEIDDPSIVVAFQLIDEPQVSILAWTTTPWTLISNLALVVGPGIDYVKIEELKSGKHYIIAADRLSTYYSDPATYRVLEKIKAADLVGKRYNPLFPHFAHLAEQGAFQVISADFVSTQDGTGIVHAAPAFGEDDFYACKAAGMQAIVCPVDRNGCFTDLVPEYQGQFVRDANKAIIRRLKESHHLIHQATLHHRYPFCWRSDTPLIYRAMESWFVSVEKIKTDLVAANQKVNWVPEHIKEGRFGKWLEGARDWAISRNRYWGTPIPLWRSADGELLCLGSIAELEKLTGQTITDLHRHHIDSLTIQKDDKTFTRVPEVFDCWFESGSVPYAQLHYPFENTDKFQERFPADFIAEGLDQTRGWFYTLTVLAVALYNQPAFKNVIVNGLILAADGNKMSKRLKNYPDPVDMIDKYGADAIRLYMMDSPAVRGDSLCFSERGLELTLRQIFLPLIHSCGFFTTYANVYKWEPTKDNLSIKKEHPLDQWIISLSERLTEEVQQGLDRYDLNAAVGPLVAFIDQLTNWYIRRSRRRFWQDESTPDRAQAFATLYEVLLTLSKLLAPFTPFLSDEIYQILRTKEMPESVHLCDYPTSHPTLRQPTLEAVMSIAQEAVSMGHGLRKLHKLKVRQPLPTAHLVSGDPSILELLKKQAELIKDELNVKELSFSSNEERFVHLSVKPNFRKLGKKIGPLMKAAQEAIKQFGRNELDTLQKGGVVTIQLEGQPVELTQEEIEIVREVQPGIIADTHEGLTIALETTLDENLLREGLARELVNKINTMRRDSGFEISDRIRIRLQTTPKVEESFYSFKDYICGEVLALDVQFGPSTGTEWDLNGEATIIQLEKA